MATYAFDTITAAEAAALGAGDTVSMPAGSANRATVLFVPGAPDTVTVIVDGRSVSFAGTLSAVSQAGRLTFGDGSRLYVGDTGANTGDGATTSDALFGGAGGDALSGRGGSDLMQGNQGDDSLIGGSGPDTIYGGQGNDSIVLGDGSNFGQGNMGDDNLVGGAGTETLLGGRDNDTISGGAGDDFLNGNLGNDQLDGGTGRNTLFGEDGDDSLSTGSDTRSAASGGAGSDTVGGAGLLQGDDGDDRLTDSAGNDTLIGGAGNDVLFLSGWYADRVQGTGVNVADGGAGDDYITIDGATNTVSGGDGNDTVNAPLFLNILGRDTIDGGAGDDVITFDNSGDRRVFGGEGNDTISRPSGYADGGAGNDRVNGSGTIFGGDGADTVSGGLFADRDLLSGGSGSDQFSFATYLLIGRQPLSSTASGQCDQITDWESIDTLRFATAVPRSLPTSVAGTVENYREISAATYDTGLSQANGLIAGGIVRYVAVQVGSDVVVFAEDDNNAANGADEAVILVGRSLADIAAGNFVAGTYV